MKTLLTVMLAMSLAACGERAQTLGSGGNDATPYSGTGKAYVVEGWKQGDKSSWESQLKARSQYGQNDFSRMN